MLSAQGSDNLFNRLPTVGRLWYKVVTGQKARIEGAVLLTLKILAPLMIRMVLPCLWILGAPLLASGSSAQFIRLSLKEGLSQSTVTSIFQDQQGFIWVGTSDGLNRYDGIRFTTYRSTLGNPMSLTNNYITSLFEDRSGVLWVGTRDGLNRMEPDLPGRFQRIIRKTHEGLRNNYILELIEDETGSLWVASVGGLHRFDRAEQAFHSYNNDPNDPASISGSLIWSMKLDRKGALWLGTDDGLDRFDTKTGGITHYDNDPNDPTGLSHKDVLCLAIDGDRGVWVGTRKGLNYLDLEQGCWRRYLNHEDHDFSLSGNRVRHLFLDPEGILWVATNNGLNRLEAGTDRFEHYRSVSGDPHSLSHDNVRFITQDQTGVLWVGTNGGGLSLLDRSGNFFVHYRNQPGNVNSLGNNFVKAITRDKNGRNWIGTRMGLNQLDVESGRFTRIEHEPSNSSSLSHNTVSSLLADREGRLWVGTDGGGLNLLEASDLNAGRFRFRRYRTDPNDPTSLPGDIVQGLMYDRSGHLWVGTFSGEIALLAPKTHRFSKFPQAPGSSSTGDPIHWLMQDSTGEVWAGTSGGGLKQLDLKAETITVFVNDPEDPRSLSNDNVTCAYESRSGDLWLGTYGGGLNRMVEANGEFDRISTQDGLPNDVIYGILEEQDGHLWISTNLGLCRFNPRTGAMSNFDVNDGLQSNEFNTNAFYCAPDGEMFFGGINGFNSFFPWRIKPNSFPPQTAITEFLLNNNPVPVEPLAAAGEHKGLVLAKNVNRTHEVQLAYDDKMISFQFAVLHFAQPAKNRLQYMLAGFDKSWIEVPSRRQVTYTNLDPGSYMLHARGLNKDGLLDPIGTTLHLIVPPPPWKTWWAICLYVIVLLAIIGFLVHSQGKKLAYERSVVERLRQVDKLKDEFLANTSHELRTPLNGIIGLAESLVDGVAGDLPEKAHNNLAMIVASGRSLNSMVNDILDFSRLRDKGMELHREPMDLRVLTDVVLKLIQPLATRKGLQLKNELEQHLPPVLADEKRLRQVLFNLLGNAIKFTEKGSICVAAREREGFLAISVTDTGIGIPLEKQERIFESFEQADGSIERTFGGTGLGLAITRKLVGLHGGKIQVSSVPGAGSVFTFTLPLAEIGVGVAPLDENATQLSPLMHLEVAAVPKPQLPIDDHDEGDFHILIVDDEPINHQVLIDLLAMRGYHSTSAVDGRNALQLLDERPFDLVLLDVMMPGMSGYEVCQHLRKRFRVQDLPVLFLTAKTQEEDLVLGFDVGGNDYLTKPVNRSELASRVHTHLCLLDINRNLEKKVVERTEELAQKNEELEVKNTRLIKRQGQLIVQEKMASLGTLTAGIAHEIRNPLNFILNFSSLAGDIGKEIQEEFGKEALDRGLMNELTEDLIENTNAIRNHSERAERIVAAMMQLSAEGKGTRGLFCIKELLHKVVDIAFFGKRKQIKREQIRLILDFDDTPCELVGVLRDLSRVLLNLINNALESLAEKKQEQADFVPELVCRVGTADGRAQICIRDNGIGIPEASQKAIFDPFFTTKQTGQGHIGLGLHIAFSIVVQGHGGELAVNSEEGEFAEFQINLPQQDPG